MKNLFFISFLAIAMIQLTACGQNGESSSENNAESSTEQVEFTGQTETIMVYGNCGMCKDRIETALNGEEAIQAAEWDVDTKMLSFRYEEQSISVDAIHQLVAGLGHDTKKALADDEVYENLPACCQYERLEKSKM